MLASQNAPLKKLSIVILISFILFFTSLEIFLRLNPNFINFHIIKSFPETNVKKKLLINLYPSYNAKTFKKKIGNYYFSLYKETYFHPMPKEDLLIGAKNFIGIGATVIDNISTVALSFVGGGALVNKNIEESGLFVGVPSKKIK